MVVWLDEIAQRYGSTIQSTILHSYTWHRVDSATSEKRRQQRSLPGLPMSPCKSSLSLYSARVVREHVSKPAHALCFFPNRTASETNNHRAFWRAFCPQVFQGKQCVERSRSRFCRLPDVLQGLGHDRVRDLDAESEGEERKLEPRRPR